MDPVLTVAVPVYNMEWCLEKNLRMYCSSKLEGDLEVIILNNRSDDGTENIARRFCLDYPRIFKLYNRQSRGYGSSINQAVKEATGKYFRIIDADDWVSTSALEQLIQRLKSCDVDIVQTDYTIVDMQSGEKTVVSVKDVGCPYDVVWEDFQWPIRTLPSLHSTTYRTSLLKDSGFYMQDGIFFVDEEYIVLPYFQAKSIIYYPMNVYQYQVANPEQSTSPKNRGKHAAHRKQILKRLIEEYYQALEDSAYMVPYAREYCFERIRRGIADHFTTLYIYVADRKEGRKLAQEWQQYIRAVDLKLLCERKRRILLVLNWFRVRSTQYIRMKSKLKHFLRGL